MNIRIGTETVIIPRNGALGFDASSQLCAYDVREPLTSYVENSICEPEVGSLEWAYDWDYGTNEVAEVSRAADGSWLVNPDLLTGGYRQRLNLFCPGPGTTAVTLRVVAKRYAAANSKLKLTITDFGGANPTTQDFTLTDAWATYEITASVTAASLYWAFVSCCFSGSGQIGDNRFYVQSVKIVPTASSGVLSANFFRLGLANMSCNNDTGIVTTALVPKTSALAFKRFRTNAAAALCEFVPSLQSGFPNECQIALLDESQDYPYKAISAGLQWWNMNAMPSGDQRLDLISGATAKSTGVLYGSFLRALYLPKNCTWSIHAVAPTWTVYGDSISCGFGADVPPTEGWTALLRADLVGKLAIEAYGNRTLNEDASSAPLRTAHATKLVGYGAHNYVFAIGTNDYGATSMTVAAFQTAYGAMLDALLAADPEADVYCITPIRRETESGNSNGETLAQFRAAIATAVSSRTSFCTLIDGTTLMDAEDLDATGVHPTSTGHAAIAAALRPILGIS